MAPFPDVSPWPGVEINAPLTGGARAAVYAARRGNQGLVVKVSTRSQASLAWELDLLRALHDAGLSVPTALPTARGDEHHHGVWIQPFLPGGPPTRRRDWQAAAEVIAAVHGLTAGWPQRPGAATAHDLLKESTGADVDLTAMPAEAVALVRACWRALLEALSDGERQPCVVHGDFGSGAVLVDGGRVSVIDWDEARVDVPAFDLGGLPRSLRRLDGLGGRSIEAIQDVLDAAALAWEIATCWNVEPAYARRCLTRLEQGPTTLQ
jgi:Ser/Thr protein kinase RdoA (MazF antagonist)